MNFKQLKHLKDVFNVLNLLYFYVLYDITAKKHMEGSAPEEIKVRLKISDILSYYGGVCVSKDSGSWWCLIHEAGAKKQGHKTPSLVAKDDIGTATCLSRGCFYGDDIFGVIGKMENITSFHDQKKRAMEIAGISDSSQIFMPRTKNVPQSTVQHSELQDIQQNVQITESPLEERHFKYFNHFGISNKIVQLFGLQSRNEYVVYPQIKHGKTVGKKFISIRKNSEGKRRIFFEGEKAPVWGYLQNNDVKNNSIPNNIIQSSNHNQNFKKHLFFTEGEKDCMRLTQAIYDANQNDQFCAITVTTGAKTVPAEIAQIIWPLQFLSVSILYDNDPAGKDGSEALAKKLASQGIASTVYYFNHENKEGYDITDFFLEGGKFEDILNLELQNFNSNFNPNESNLNANESPERFIHGMDGKIYKAFMQASDRRRYETQKYDTPQSWNTNKENFFKQSFTTKLDSISSQAFYPQNQQKSHIDNIKHSDSNEFGRGMWRSLLTEESRIHKQGSGIKNVDTEATLNNSGKNVFPYNNVHKKLNEFSDNFSNEFSVASLVTPVKIEEIINEIKSSCTLINTGYKIANEDLFISPSAISIFVAPTSHGKTMMQINLAVNIAKLYPEKSVHFFSFEEQRCNIFLKALNCYAEVKLSEDNFRTMKHEFIGNNEYIKASVLNSIEYERYISQKQDFLTSIIEQGRLAIHYVDVSVEDLIHMIELLKANTNVCTVIIDYIQLLSLADRNKTSRHEELKIICQKLKNCAIRTGLAIVLGSQFNRQVISANDLMATNIGEAGDIERIAALVIGMWNNNFNQSERESSLLLKVLKNRNGKAGLEEKFAIDGNLSKISQIIKESGKKEYKF